MAKESPEEKSAREAREQEAKNLDAATPDPAESTTDAVAAGNVAAAEAAGRVSRAAAEAAGTDTSTPNPDKTRPADRTATAQTTPSNGKGSKKFDLIDKFIDLSGYKASDVIGHNDERRTVVTANGGKYEVSKKGTKLRKLLGPDTPATREAAEEEDDD